MNCAVEIERQKQYSSEHCRCEDEKWKYLLKEKKKKREKKTIACVAI